MLDHPDGTWLRLVLLILAAWRLTHLLAHEDGPADAVVRLRQWLGDSAVGRALDCFLCLSLWVALPLAPLLGPDRASWPLAWLAISGGACLLERATAPREQPATPLVMLEDPGDADATEHAAAPGPAAERDGVYPLRGHGGTP